MEHWLSRTELLLGNEILHYLQSKNILVVGLGGVGAYAAEHIVRSGIGTLTIVDADVYSLTNINRQLGALHSTIGLNKTDVLKQRFLDINPEVKITTVKNFISKDEIIELLNQNFDYVIDAIDTLQPKVDLAEACVRKNIPLVSSLGSGGKRDISQIQVAEIENTHSCKLGFYFRKRLHRLGIRSGFKAVFSPEVVPREAIEITEETNKVSFAGTISYMPAAYGLHCAATVINDLLKKRDDIQN
ncbi:MAG: tRNA threonylcarbamoyladenosine dehydratase [Bacteroidales bacterium]|nr:tRNA threonylcarbamoyladenosine dehydratase [Bacteroidales bacterium]